MRRKASRFAAICVGLGSMLASCGDGDGSVAIDSSAAQEPSTTSADPAAVERCEARRIAVGPDLHLVGAFSTDVGTLRHWRSDRLIEGEGLPSGLAHKPDVDPVVVCFIDGTFETPGPPGHPVPDRAVFYVDETGYGEPVLFGSSSELAVERPRAAGAG
jgi:hypothetical protein